MRKILCRLIIIMCALLFGVAHACDTNQIDVLGDGTNCIDTKFSLTTTSLTLPDESEFRWYMSASGTFYVDCGTDGTLSGTGVVGKTITRTNTTESLYTCTYTSGGTKTIRIAGLATGYNSSTLTAAISFYQSSNTPTKITSLDGNLATIFPWADNAPANAQPRFYRTFQRSTSITSIPSTLFSGYVDGTEGMFHGTFAYCFHLTSIPNTLFKGITGSAPWMFATTFDNCSALQFIPDELFADVSNVANNMFYATFYGCPSLTGYIPASTFATLIASNSPYVNDAFRNIFVYSPNLATTCPTGTTQFITGYEDYWNGHVSCTPNVITINWDDGNGGGETTTCTYGGTITTPTTAPTKRGHTFIGWRFVAPSGN